VTEGIRTIVLIDKSKFFILFDSEKKPCKYCKKEIQWGYMENGRAASVEEIEGKFRLHFPQCLKMHQAKYAKEYVPLTNGVETDESRVSNIRYERRRYVR
jgi:hypothetical protein